MRRFMWVSATCAALAIAAAAKGDVIVLQDGRELEGRVVRQSRYLVVLEHRGTRYSFKATDVKEVRLEEPAAQGVAEEAAPAAAAAVRPEAPASGQAGSEARSQAAPPAWDREGPYDPSMINFDPRDPAYEPYREARRLLDAGRSAESIPHFDEALQRNPRYFRAYLNRGAAHIELGNYEDAIADATRTIELEPYYWMPYYNRSIALARLGRPDEAARDATRVIELNPTNDLYLWRAELLITVDDREQALADVLHVLQGEPDSSKARSLFRWLSAEIPREAAAQLDRAIAERPTQADLYLLRADLLHQGGEVNRASENINQAIRLDLEHGRALLARGKHRASIRDTSGALEDFSRALNKATDTDLRTRSTSPVHGPYCAWSGPTLHCAMWN